MNQVTDIIKKYGEMRVLNNEIYYLTMGFSESGWFASFTNGGFQTMPGTQVQRAPTLFEALKKLYD